MSSYSFSFVTDFASSFNQSQFHQEVANSIVTQLSRIDKNDDVIDVVFVESLDSSQITSLNNLVSSHTPSTVINSGIINTLSPRLECYSNTTYTKIISFSYLGTQNTDPILAIKCLSRIDNGSYSVRLYDITHHLVIAEKSFSNVETGINDLGAISNIPSSVSVLEFQIKLGSSSNTVSIDEVSYLI